MSKIDSVLQVNRHKKSSVKICLENARNVERKCGLMRSHTAQTNVSLQIFKTANPSAGSQ